MGGGDVAPLVLDEMQKFDEQVAPVGVSPKQFADLLASRRVYLAASREAPRSTAFAGASGAHRAKVFGFGMVVHIVPLLPSVPAGHDPLKMGPMALRDPAKTSI
jgi:hypothetical protein